MVFYRKCDHVNYCYSRRVATVEIACVYANRFMMALDVRTSSYDSDSKKLREKYARFGDTRTSCILIVSIQQIWTRHCITYWCWMYDIHHKLLYLPNIITKYSPSFERYIYRVIIITHVYIYIIYYKSIVFLLTSACCVAFLILSALPNRSRPRVRSYERRPTICMKVIIALQRLLSPYLSPTAVSAVSTALSNGI